MPPRIRDLQLLPRFSDGWSFLYVERAEVDRESNAVVIENGQGRVAVPSASLSALLLGPGTRTTHAAIALLADTGCTVVWCGQGMVRCYASGLGETRRAANLMHQAKLWADEVTRAEVVLRMYRMRFTEELDPSLTLEQVRGKEGVRVRETYAALSRETGIPWRGRSYKKDEWTAADPVNRALSAANSCLYGLCHAALLATGFSPSLGFLHTGKALSFVYDVADLYKADITIPLAFRSVALGTDGLESRVRRLCRETFHRFRLLERIVPDVQRALGLQPEQVRAAELYDEDAVARIWDPVAGELTGGRNFAEDA